MKLREAAIVPDTRVFALSDVSKEAGRKRMEQLESEGKIKVVRTPMGRRWLSVADAERLANAL
jgi:hypothetical protein